MVIMGVDQSLTSTGITIYNGSVYDYSLIETEKTKGTKAPTIDYTRRLIKIKNSVKTLIKNFGIEYVAIEGMAFGSKGRVVFDLGGLSHILRELFIDEGIPFLVVPPTTLKKYWVGKGNAKKDQMIQECIDRGYSIPIMKNYGTVKEPDEKPDDNVVDSQALCSLLNDFIQDKLSDEVLTMIEKSIDV